MAQRREGKIVDVTLVLVIYHSLASFPLMLPSCLYCAAYIPMHICLSDHLSLVSVYIHLRKHGHGTYLFADGGRYVGSWKNDRMEGDECSEYFFASGDYYRGQFKFDCPHGNGEATYAATGTRFKGNFKNGLPCGRGVMIKSDGTELEGTWRDGKRIAS